MKRVLLTLSLATVALSAMGQGDIPKTAPSVQTVSVSSKGLDVRGVLHDLFTQAKKSYVLEPNVHFVLYLSLSDMEFEETLGLVCKTANLKYEVQNGIYFVSRASAVKGAMAIAIRQEAKLPVTVLRNKISVAYQKVDIRALFTDLAKQSELNIEVSPTIPSYKLDVVLKDTSLKFALQTVCRAAGLSYRFTDHLSIEIYKPESANRATLHN